MPSSIIKNIGVALIVFSVLVAVIMNKLGDQAAMNEPEQASPYKLALQWPGSYYRSCVPAAEDFSIHGLWPQNPNVSTPFDPRQISDLRTELNTEWPTLNCNDCSNERFWQYEWTKHGTGDIKTYFKNALEIKEKVDLYSAMSKKHIRPDDSRTYNLNEMLEAVKDGVPGRPNVQIRCDNESRLREVYICLNKKLEFIPCYGITFPECTAPMVLFPSPKRVRSCYN